ncbi:MAG: type II CAAX endopeptidase family protein [Reyranellaceae bacterium]
MEQNGNPRIRWWSLAIFAAVAPAVLVAAVRLLEAHTMLPLLASFFGAGVVAVAAATAPLGAAAPAALGFRRTGWKSIVLGTLVALAISVAVTQLGIEPEGIKQAMDLARDPALFVAALAIMAGLAPLAEELVFRGLLYGWLAGLWGTRVAWLISSLAFAAAHVELAHVLLVLPLGLWLGWLRRRSGSLWPSLVAHMLNNALAVGAALLPED